MADALVSAVLQQLVKILYEQAEQEVNLVVGVDREIQNLISNFETIQAVLQDAERRQVKEGSVRVWLNKLQELSYDVEDVLDEWKTALIRSKIREQSKRSQNKVRSFIPSPCFCVKQVDMRHDIGNKIKELNEKLAFINRQKQDFGFVIHERVAVSRERPDTTSIIAVEEVLGRETDKISIKSMLMSSTNSGGCGGQEKKVPRVVSIVGMGGIGKTTLAQSVYSDEEITAHFDLRIWICVSDSFDETRMAKEIIQKCYGNCPKVEAMDMILEQICEHVSKKKVLLVFDDVWTWEIGKWDQLMYALKCTASGSRILATTRKQEAAMVLGSREVDILHLGILKDNDSWLLFTQFAFHDRTSDEIKLLEGVGKKIMDKCEGLPLAVKIIGSYLRFKRTREEWEHVLMSDTWKIKDVEKEVFGPLLLSYYELPDAAKRCFIHCALFPKDYRIDKNELIRLWMAQGFFKERNEAELEAKVCLNVLAMRSFLQDFTISDFEESFNMYDLLQGQALRHFLRDFSIFNVKGFAKMHDIVHDFAMFLSGDEYSCVEDFNGIVSLKEGKFGKSIRHIFLYVRNEKTLHFPNGREKLRSLHIECTLDSGVDLSTLDWTQFKRLRTFKIRNLMLEVVPSSIGKLEHLRHLDLSRNSKLRALPEEICDSCNLETLDITACQNLEKLPQRIGELINLKYLMNNGTPLNPVPKGIARLVDIIEIHSFVLGNGENEANLSDLGNLSNIEALKIRGLGNIKDASEGMKARLADKTKLKKLELHFNTTRRCEVEKEKQEQLLEALSPPPSCLEVLELREYSGRPQRLPAWIESLSNLKRLLLDRLSEWEQLPPLGKLLPTLEQLDLWCIPRVKRVGVEFLGLSTSSAEMQQQPVVVFPNLKSLWFEQMSGWEEWDWSEEEVGMITIMPRLIHLRITACGKLTAIPQQLFKNPGLKNLEILGCDTLSSRYRSSRTDVELPSQ